MKEAVVIGDGRKYLTALIGIELDTVGNWALRKGIPYTTYRDLSEKPEVIELIQGVVDDVNEQFARVENIRKFRTAPQGTRPRGRRADRDPEGEAQGARRHVR